MKRLLLRRRTSGSAWCAIWQQLSNSQSENLCKTGSAGERCSLALMDAVNAYSLRNSSGSRYLVQKDCEMTTNKLGRCDGNSHQRSAVVSGISLQAEDGRLRRLSCNLRQQLRLRLIAPDINGSKAYHCARVEAGYYGVTTGGLRRCWEYGNRRNVDSIFTDADQPA